MLAILDSVRGNGFIANSVFASNRGNVVVARSGPGAIGQKSGIRGSVVAVFPNEVVLRHAIELAT